MIPAMMQGARLYGRDQEREPFNIEIKTPVKCFDSYGEPTMLHKGEIVEALDLDAERGLWITVEYGTIRMAEAQLVD